jgi:hypothetical protein
LTITGWWFGTFLFFHILGIIIRTDYIIFFKRGETTNQIKMFAFSPTFSDKPRFVTSVGLNLKKSCPGLCKNGG